MLNVVFCLMGPTAVGKTALACELIKQYPFDLISVDSAMIYRDMNIGTAKPSVDELKAAPHYLIDIKDPVESYSAAQFCSDVHALCESIIAQGRIPLLTGGTMMYFNALQKGLAALPDANEALRKQMEQEAALHGWEHLHQKLMLIDPQAAARIHSHDAQRIQRALEVYYLTGTPLSVLHHLQKPQTQYQFVNFALIPGQRSWLHDRIELRFKQMLAQGFIDEVRGLQLKWQVDMSMPSMRCVGYRQALEYLQGSSDEGSMIDKGVAATRQLAKRQLTWLRHWDNLTSYDAQSSTFNTEIIAKIGEILDNRSRD